MSMTMILDWEASEEQTIDLADSGSSELLRMSRSTRTR